MIADFVLPLVINIGECLVAPVRRQFCYLISYEKNITNLEKQVQDLEDKRFGVQSSVDEAETNREAIAPEVERWLTMVNEISEETKKFLEDEVKANKGCLNGWCPNLKSRYSLSRKATKKTQRMEELLSREGKFPRVSYPVPRVGITFTSTGGYNGFESRRSIMNDVMKSLEDDSIDMIGICGMGGVGKTTMVKEVVKKAVEKRMFKKIVMVEVSQNPDLINIQGDIAKIMDFELFGRNNLFARAEDLRSRILNSGRVLVILDDVWKRLELNDIGIPFGDHHQGCKIVLTSRSEDVCNDMCTRHIFLIKVLPEEEAWNLFKEKAGISNDTSDFHSTQMAVANECGGLPIAIVTVGRALNGRTKPSWDYALRQLQKSTGKNIKGVEEEVFKPLELSYKFLEIEEAKKCFLLCSLFPEDFNIPIEDLVRYEVGLELFKDIDTVGEARDRVHDLVVYLKKCYLLMGSRRNDCIKMHDVIRDVAISITSREEYSFIVRCDDALKDWAEKDQHKNYVGISLRANGIHRPNDNLEFRKLHLLQLGYMDNYKTLRTRDNNELLEIPCSLFDGMEELKVVALSKMCVRSLLTSLQCLTNLRTLSLMKCRLVDIDISSIGALVNLEILSFAGSEGIKELPKEIGQLSHLKVLDLLYCHVKRIYPGIFSSLSKLEELYVGSGFTKWEVVEEGKERTNASITELMSLSNLVALDIQIHNLKFLAACWPRDVVLEKVSKFSITVGRFYPYYMPENGLRLHGLDMCDLMESGLKMLLKISKTLWISEIKGLKNIFYDLDEDGLQHLTRLRLANCRDLEYLICTIDGVPERAFPMLESLTLTNLHIFKGIVSHASQISKKAFCALKQLNLESLPKLTHLWKDPAQLVSAASDSNYDTIIQPLFHNKVNLANIEMLFVRDMDNLIEIWPEELQAKIKRMTIHRCQRMPNILFPLNLMKGMQSLGQLEVGHCRSVEVAFDLEGLIVREGHPNILLPSLTYVNLQCLPKLTHVWKGNLPGFQGFQNLRFLEIAGCDSLRYVFSSSLAKLLVQLQEIQVIECCVMETIIGEEPKVNDEVTTNIIKLPQLKTLTLRDLPNLRSFCLQTYTFEGSSLKTVKVINCPNLKVLPLTFQHRQEKQSIDAQNIGFFTSAQDHLLDEKILSKQGKLTITGIDETTEIWHSQLEVGCLHEIRVMQVLCCGKLSSVVSSNLMQRLQKIEMLKVWWCDSLEVIYDLQGEVYAGVGEKETSITSLNKLELKDLPNLELRDLPNLELKYPPNLDLKYLPKLMHIWKNIPRQTHCFKNLISLKVERCDSLRYVFTISMANALVNLEYLTIGHCEKVEQIVTRENAEEILSQRFYYVKLEDLPSIVCFGPDVNDTEIPASNYRVVFCPKLPGPYSYRW